MSFFSTDEKASLDELTNCTVIITREGTSTATGRGALVPGAPVVVLESQPAQEWDLTSQQSVGLTGEEVMLRKNLRLTAYYPELTEKMTCVIDGVKHNILNVGHEGMKEFSMLLVRKVSG